MAAGERRTGVGATGGGTLGGQGRRGALVLSGGAVGQDGAAAGGRWGWGGVSLQDVHSLVATPFGSSVGKPNLVFNEEISPRAEFPLEDVLLPPRPLVSGSTVLLSAEASFYGACGGRFQCKRGIEGGGELM